MKKQSLGSTGRRCWRPQTTHERSTEPFQNDQKSSGRRQPPQYSVGGTRAKMSFQGSDRMWRTSATKRLLATSKLQVGCSTRRVLQVDVGWFRRNSCLVKSFSATGSSLSLLREASERPRFEMLQGSHTHGNWCLESRVAE